MKAVEITDNGNDTWTARIYSETFTGTYQQCMDWLTNHGECV